MLPRPRARAALLAGFGALLTINVAGAIDMWFALRELQSRSSTVLREYLHRDQILQRARDSAYLSTTYLRDFVLDPDPSQSQAHLAALRSLRAQLDAAITEYSPLVDANEHGAFEELVAGVARYWKDVDPIFNWSPQQRRQRGFQFLAQQILPQRVRLLALTDSIASINHQELRHRENLLSDLYYQAKWRLGLIFAVSLLLGVTVAVISFVYLSRLERGARSSFNELLKTREELERLSIRLVEAQEQERRALSRELHDEVGQSLSALLVDVANAAAASPPGNSDLEARHNSIRCLAEQTLHVIRNMSLLLRPSMLDDLGLVPALEWQAREMSRRTGLTVRVEAGGIPDHLPEDVRTCVYRLVQEALNNSLRHAAAHRVDIILRLDDARLLVLVRDDGVGFDPQTLHGSNRAAGRMGAGLIGIDERVRVLGGAVRVESSPGRGCLVQAELPLAPSALQPAAAAPGSRGPDELNNYDLNTSR
jgi:signal transduction histidine kinase